MFGILDLSIDEKAKHFLPRWLNDAPTWINADLSMIRKRSWNFADSLTVSELAYCALNRATSTAWSRSLRLFFTTRTKTPARFCAMSGNTESSKYGSIKISYDFAINTNFFI